jgi:hypothetical protein
LDASSGSNASARHEPDGVDQVIPLPRHIFDVRTIAEDFVESGKKVVFAQ